MKISGPLIQMKSGMIALIRDRITIVAGKVSDFSGLLDRRMTQKLQSGFSQSI